MFIQNDVAISIFFTNKVRNSKAEFLLEVQLNHIFKKYIQSHVWPYAVYIRIAFRPTEILIFDHRNISLGNKGIISVFYYSNKVKSEKKKIN